MLDIFSIQPHVVSRNLVGYSVLFYGDPKSGKTTTASKFPKSLLVAFEKGYAAIPGVMAAPVNSWSEFLKLLKQLREPAAKERFETIVIDTADIAYDYVEQYICNVNSVDAINKIPFGQGFTMAGKEFDSKLRQIVQLGYGLVLISHATDKQFKDEQGAEFNKIVPTLGNKPRLICQRLCDIIAYSRAVETGDGLKTMLFMRGTPRFEAGSRFKYTPDFIEFSYKNLVDAIGDAIDKQAEEDGGAYITNDKQNLHGTAAVIDYDAAVAEFSSIVGLLMEKDATFYAPRITEIVERYLGKGKKVAECSRDQAQLIDMIVYDIKELV
jgi:hypothetical protein